MQLIASVTDRLLHNPHVQPPLPSDWEVHPTYPRHNVPYSLAPLWDVMAREAALKEGASNKRKDSKGEDGIGKVPKDLREKFKRAKGAKGLLQALEEEVRMFLTEWDKREKKLRQEGVDELDSEDEEIVFVGRNGQMSDLPSPRKSSEADQLERDKLVFDSLVEDHGASFGRWLVHCIASYYGLRTWSVTVGDPARREAYVGIKEAKTKTDSRLASSDDHLPRPLWGMV